MPGRFWKSSPEDQATAKAVVDALELGEQVTFEELVDIIAEKNGKPIELLEVPNEVISTVTGLWVEKDTKSLILLPQKDSTPHRRHTTFHEFGHMLLNHDECGLAPSEVMPSLFQHIGGRRGIKKMLARSLEWNETERAAELVAYQLSLAMLPKKPTSSTSSSSFERTFG